MTGSRVVRPLAVLLALLAAGCASLTSPPAGPDARYLEAGDSVAACARFFHALDKEIGEAGVADAQEARVPGFPYVRVNRLLGADWRPSPEDPRFDAWAERLRELDRNSRRHEIANLPEEARARVAADLDERESLDQRVGVCGGRLLALDLAGDDSRQRLFELAAAPDAYRVAYRVAGLYPLTSLAFYAGVKTLHWEIIRDFSVPLEAVPVKGRLVRYVPEPASVVGRNEIAQILRRASENPLRIPAPNGDDRDRLFNAFAPVFEIDVVQDADRIGRPRYLESPVAQVDTRDPVVYTALSHTRFESNTLLQLNYIFWFPSRPKSGPLDILAGHLDGITWRVTLDTDGAPLMVDSMHNCGCYHLFIPTRKLRRIEGKGGFEEPLLLPQWVEWQAGRSIVRIANRTHYIQRVYFEPATAGSGIRYRTEDYSALRSLPAENGGRRSLFLNDGLVRGSDRPERWLFWPMGVPSAGAMRQWGHHATAFVGRRHFDEPGLVARYFQRAKSD